ncbi:TetR/AcrR family transcriptional regulator [Rapidithrix thailandica]|uniref:TetR/AcrR family transcriptional regulator n=1 Tax=Rapidithrix thailandica TaxID=413964 RepID=A0AAW9SBF0_9BACT
MVDFINKSLTMEEKILAHAQKLLLCYGPKRVTMDDVCFGLGISKRTLYQYFPGKRELFHESLKGYYGRLQEDLDRIASKNADPMERILKMYAYIFSVLNRHSAIVILDLKRQYPRSFNEFTQLKAHFIEHCTVPALNELLQAGYVQSQLKPLLLAQLFDHHIEALVNGVLPWRGQQDLIEYYEHMILFPLKGLLTSKGQQSWEKTWAKHREMAIESLKVP